MSMAIVANNNIMLPRLLPHLTSSQEHLEALEAGEEWAAECQTASKQTVHTYVFCANSTIYYFASGFPVLFIN